MSASWADSSATWASGRWSWTGADLAPAVVFGGRIASGHAVAGMAAAASTPGALAATAGASGLTSGQVVAEVAAGAATVGGLTSSVVT